MPQLAFHLQGDMPFMVEETKNSRGGRIRVNEEDAYELLAGVRGELEVRGGFLPSSSSAVGARSCRHRPSWQHLWASAGMLHVVICHSDESLLTMCFACQTLHAGPTHPGGPGAQEGATEEAAPA
jgi:hypothetical protein